MSIFKIFKSKHKAVIEISSKQAKKSIEQQIHDDVFSNQELVLAEAMSILNSPFRFTDTQVQEMEALHRLGFSNAEDVVIYNEANSERKYKACLKENHDYYSQRYPMHRYIDEKSVESICENMDYCLLTYQNTTRIFPIRRKRLS